MLAADTGRRRSSSPRGSPPVFQCIFLWVNLDRPWETATKLAGLLQVAFSLGERRLLMLVLGVVVEVVVVMICGGGCGFSHLMRLPSMQQHMLPIAT